MIKLIGSNLDALFFANGLAKNNIEFEYFTDSKYLGGFFRGNLDCQERTTDLGMVLLEPNVYGESEKSINTFQGETGQAARGYLKFAYTELEKYSGKMQSVAVYTRDSSMIPKPDYFISDNVETFHEGNEDIREELSERMEWLETHPDYHPKNKSSKISPLESTDVEEGFRLLYGDEFYERYFSDFVRNFVGLDIRFVKTKFHRRIWLPLYWPETVSDAMDDGKLDGELSRPVFKKPASGGISQWVRELEENVKRHAIIQELEPCEILNLLSELAQDDDTYAFLNSRVFERARSDNERLVAPVLVPLRSVHVCIDQKLDEVDFVNSSESACFRYSLESISSESHGRGIFEFGAASSNLHFSDLIQQIDKLCSKMNVKRICGGKLYESRFPLNPIQRNTTPDVKNLLKNWQTVHDSGGMSLNDNLVRAAWSLNKVREGKKIES